MRHEQRAFQNETIVLDGNEFIDCTFENCVLVLAGTAPVTIQPFDLQDSTVRFEGAAKAGSDFQRHLMAIAADAAPTGSLLHLGEAWFRKLSEKPEDGPND